MAEGKHKGLKWRPPELEDQPWFPNFLREYQMAYLSAVDRVIDLYMPTQELIRNLNPKTMVDLATGSGHSAMIASKLIAEKDFQLVLTDKFPAEDLVAGHIIELDALNGSYPKADLYTMFNAYHHFSEQERLTIALNATQSDSKLLIVEPLQPTILTFLKVLIATLIGPIILTPFMRPFSWKWIVLTYLIPLGILVTVWDGLASVIKSLDKKEWNRLEDDLKRKGRSVEQGFLSSRTTKLKYFLVS